MATVVRTTTWISGQVLTASALNTEFNNLLNGLNLVNADISASAGIATSKIAAGFALLGTANVYTAKNTFVQTAQTITTYSPSVGGTATIDLTAGNLNFITMPAGNITIALSGGVAGQCFVVRILQDSGGSRTVTWFSGIHWQGNTVPTLSITGSHWDTFGFVTTSAGVYDGFIVGQNAQ